jgi:hypothetical protein
MHIECGVPAVPGGVHYVFQVLSMSPSIYLCVGDIRAIVNCFYLNLSFGY